MKKYNRILVMMFVCFTLFFVADHVSAYQQETVRVRWLVIHQTGPDGSYAEYTDGEVYKTIRFMNGYTFTESSKYVGSFWEALVGRRVWEFTRNYMTY